MIAIKNVSLFWQLLLPRYESVLRDIVKSRAEYIAIIEKHLISSDLSIDVIASSFSTIFSTSIGSRSKSNFSGFVLSYNDRQQKVCENAQSD